MDGAKRGDNMVKMIKEKEFVLLPSAKDVCQECAVKHQPEEPHDLTSLYYQYLFYGKHGRWPTWSDAMSHCSEETKTVWTRELRKIEECKKKEAIT